MTNYIADPEHPQTGLTLGPGDNLNVKSGGFAAGTTVQLLGNIGVDSGGTANKTDVQNGGGITTASGGTVNGATIEAGAFASFNGTTNNVTIRSGAQANFYGDATGTVADGGYAIYGPGSTDHGTTTGLTGAVIHTYVSAGQSFKGDIASGFGQTVAGLATGTYLGNGDQEVIAGGSAVGTTVNSGSTLIVQSGGTAYDAVINEGGQVVLSAGLIKRTQVNSGGNQINSGGVAFDTIVGPGGNQTVDAGRASATILQSGAGQTVSLNGSAVGTIVNGGAIDGTTSGGFTSAAQVSSGGFELVGVGGVSLGTVVSSGGVLGVGADQYGNVTIITGDRTIVGVKSGGTETLTAYLNGIAVGSSVSAGGVLKAYQGGKLISMEEQVGDQRTQTQYTSSRTVVIVSTNPVYTNPGTADGGEVMSGGLVVFAGGTFTGHADSGAIEQVGGSATFTLQGISETLSLAGYVVSNNQTVTDGVVETVSSGGVTVGTLVGAGGFELVLAGGMVSKTTVVGGQSEVLGASVSAIIKAAPGGMNGFQFVSSGGFATRTTLFAGASQTVGAGGQVTGTTLELNGALFVSGVATYTVISTGGVATVSAGGLATRTDVQAGGTQLLANGGSALATRLETGGFEKVSAGGSAALTTVAAGANQTVFAGGVAAGTTVSGGGHQDVSGLATLTTLQAGADEDVAFGGTTSVTAVSGGQLRLSGGFGYSTVVTDGGAEFIIAGGHSVDTDLVSGIESVDDGAAVGLKVERGGRVDVTGIGVLTDATINGGSATISNQGEADGTRVTSNGLIVAQTGGKTSGTMLLANTFDGPGREAVSAGGLALGTQIGFGATQFVEGVASNTIISSGGFETVFAGGESDGAMVASGGRQLVFGGITRGTIVQNGATEIAQAGAIAYDTIVQNGATMIAQAGAIARNTIVQAGATQIAQAGAATYDTIVKSGATEIAQAGATAYNTIVELGGTLNAFNLGTTIGAILRGGRQIVGGMDPASGTIISSGGVMVISSGGEAVSATVSGGGMLLALPGGSVSETVVAGGQVISGGVIVTGPAGVLQQATSVATIAAGAAVSGYVVSGGTANTATIGSGGYVGVLGGTLGAATLSGGTLELGSGTVAAVTLVGTGNTVQLDGAVPGATISGFGAGDAIVFAGAAFDAFMQSGDTVTLSGSGGTAQVQIAGAAAELFSLSLSAAGTVLGVACYAAGTLIATDRGERPVESLSIGDNVLTASGEARPIKWLGRRSYAGRFLAANPDIMPIRFAAGSLGAGLPRRALLVSPEHAMMLDGQLVPARCLVDGQGIAPTAGLDRVEYHHVELDSHDVILAEGAASETFVDDGSRAMFQNAAEYRVLYPDRPARAARFCAPRVEDGEALEAVRARLQAVTAPAVAPPLLRGFLDTADRGSVTGWARDPAAPGVRLHLQVRVDGVVVGSVVADQQRADLVEAGEGDGRHAFVFVVPGGLAPDRPHVVEVRGIADGAALEGSPARVEAAESVTPGAAATLRGALDTVERDRIQGWAWEPGSAAPVAVQVVVNGAVLARVLANRHRPDLLAAGIGHGRHAFDVTVPGGLSPLTRHVVEVRRERDGAVLPGSPMVIEAAEAFDAALEDAVSRAVAALPTDRQPGGASERVLSFMLGQAEQLLQRRATAEGDAMARQALQRFRRRWGRDAGEQGPEAPSTRLRVLVVDERVPVAGRDAGSMAVLSHMRAFTALGYAVSLSAADEMAADGPLPDAPEIRVYGAPFYAGVEDVLRRQTGCFDVVYLHRASVAQRYATLVRTHQPRARLVYAVADLHHVRLARQADVEGRPELLGAARRMRLAECMAALTADCVVTHSENEAALLRTAVAGVAVHRVPWAVPVATRAPSLAVRSGVGFVGPAAHAPNADAARWLVQAVMPLVWAEEPGLPCILIGTMPPALVQELSGPLVHVLGHVPDLVAAVGRLRLTVAPLRFGAGVKGKVLDSLAARTPCVMTRIAAEGIGLPPVLRSLVSDDPAGLAARIVRLHRDDEAHRAAVRAGVALVRREHSLTAVEAALSAALCGDAIAAQAMA